MDFSRTITDPAGLPGGENPPSKSTGADHGSGTSALTTDPVAIEVERAIKRLTGAEHLAGRTPRTEAPVLICTATVSGKLCGKGPNPKRPDRCLNNHFLAGNTANGVSNRRHLADREQQVTAGADRLLVDIGYRDPSAAPEMTRNIATKCAALDVLADRALAGNGSRSVSSYLKLIEQQQSLMKALAAMRPPTAVNDPTLQRMTLEEMLAETAALHERIAAAIGVEARLRPLIDAWVAAEPARLEDGAEPGPDRPALPKNLVGGPADPLRTPEGAVLDPERPGVSADAATAVGAASEPAPGPPLCGYACGSLARCAEIKATRLESWRALHYTDPIEVERRRREATAEMLTQMGKPSGW